VAAARRRKQSCLIFLRKIVWQIPYAQRAITQLAEHGVFYDPSTCVSIAYLLPRGLIVSVYLNDTGSRVKLGRAITLLNSDLSWPMKISHTAILSGPRMITRNALSSIADADAEGEERRTRVSPSLESSYPASCARAF